ncbi:tetratricopeptide repeat protein [Lysobacter auxotrophicus]|uniref:Tetratricopeptide repeat protein n=1 Tax=Lysobacter auxotrophicus TaxID=2992573 RepID=A0ABM8DCB7_9GAMM|nr:tetratricopeptide repeat protein [Lysobacter auxotrophicus]BDU16217.1 tetratricopeptide repeat protein [Lysobacter auxotrophicus]
MGSAMVGFVIAGLVLAVLTLAYVLRPLWRTRRVAGVAVIAGLTLATAMAYVAIGTPAALDNAQREMPRTLDEAISKLEAELQRDPNQIEGWRLLGRAYIAQGNAAKASDALSHAIKLAPDDPDLLAEAAEMRALAAPERRFDEQGVAMLRHAIELQPMHQRARWFLGIAQRQASQPAEAARTWEPLLTTIVDAAAAAPLRAQIDAARAEAGLPPLPAAAAASTASAQAPTKGGMKVKVSVTPELAAKIPPNATLFVIARQPGGPPMPVAAEKLPATGFPREITLDDNDSPMPTLKLSQLHRVEVLARISVSGDATPEPGDMEAKAKVSDKSGVVELVIDSVRP